MARLQGISGGLSGKTGSYTFRQSRGQTIVSQYQPVVKNPNTQGQQNQRARFKLMTQLAAVMAPGFGTMGVTKRAGKAAPTQRNAFVQLNMPIVEVESQADNSVVAKIPMEQVKLTSSFRPLGTMTLEQNPDTGIGITLQSIPSEVSTVRVVVVGYANQQAVIHSITDYPAAQGTIDEEIATGNGKFTVLAYGLIPSESAKISLDLDNIHTPADEDFISAVELNAMVANGEMAETMTVGANVTVASA